MADTIAGAGTMAGYYNEEETELLRDCTLCPRECHADRFNGDTGYCGIDAGLNIASVCVHRGEEPPISGDSGICNIFFRGCNLRCIYCQNHEISRPPGKLKPTGSSFEELTGEIGQILESGVRAVGFVSPSHVVPQVRAIIRRLREHGRNPVFVYNTGSYDKAGILRGMEGYIDVYLPDYKYVTPSVARQFSDSEDYPETALRAIKEMYYQKGSSLRVDDQGRAENGLLLRHLVLPGHSGESIKVLGKIAGEISAGIHISLMSQYYPNSNVQDHSPLDRPLYREEYETVVREMERLGFRNGWIQDMDSSRNYRPDFSKEHPFT